MIVGTGRPTAPGLYAAEVFCGWKLLDWSADRGWHLAGVCGWNAGDPVQWVGPLPPRMKDQTSKQVFDL